jgi:hypothetical protein
MLWCVMNGPQGGIVRRLVSDALLKSDRATIVVRRDRATKAVGTEVLPDDSAIITADIVRAGGKGLSKGGYVSLLPTGAARREDA